MDIQTIKSPLQTIGKNIKEIYFWISDDVNIFHRTIIIMGLGVGKNPIC